MPTVDIIAGARPNFMKIAPIIHAIAAKKAEGFDLDYRLVHTGQHYDAKMSGDFFDQLGIPAPDVNLEVGSGTHAEQTAAIMTRYEKLLMETPADLCLVVGDVTSTMACAITAKKLWIPVAHVEGGLRSGDWAMPEEVNRVVTDSISDYFFTTSANANGILKDQGVPDERILFVGNTMIDTLLGNMDRFRAPHWFGDLNLELGEYFVMTLHRPRNVDGMGQLQAMISAIGSGCRGLPVLFPVHPRTAKALKELAELPENIQFVEPLAYLEFNYIVKHAKAMITDSGGITEETTVMGVPCMTLRDNTERPETVTEGTNEVLGTDPSALKPALDRLFAGEWKSGSIPEKWDGKTGPRIADHLTQLLGAVRGS